MAHGSRGQARRMFLAGLGFVLCTSLVGCMETERKPVGMQRQPGVGLPGTPMVNNTRPGQPGFQPVGGQPSAFGAQPNTGFQPAGAFGAQPNTGFQPAGGMVQPGGVMPAGGQPYGRTGTYGVQTVPGAAPAPVGSSVVPPVGPYPSSGSYPGPTGALTPSSAPLSPAGSIRGQVSDFNPPVASLTDPGPVPPVTPSTSGSYAPQAPLSPSKGS